MPEVYNVNSFDRRYINKHNSPVQVKDVTLACVDCVNPELAVIALNASMNGIEFDRVVLFSHEKPSNINNEIEFIRIPKLDFNGYQEFCLRELHKYIKTKHVLNIETDGWVIRPELWNNLFLKYDYIGAPWPKDKWWAIRNRVGNSGFCLRSRNLLYQTSLLTTDDLIRKQRHFAVDIFTCDALYDELINRGIKFAPPVLAAKFSNEDKTEFSNVSFGYHGKNRHETKFLENRLEAYHRYNDFINSERRVNVIYNLYTAHNSLRQKELDECLNKLTSNKFLNVIIVGGRPSFQELINLGNEISDSNDISVIMNSDCYLDFTAADLCCIEDNEFMCLTRHETGPRGWELWNVIWSQDAWAWKGKCRLSDMPFLPGTMGCDNKIMYEAHKAGYDIINPSRSIRVCHLHAGEYRSAIQRVGGPYAYMLPHLIFESNEIKIDMNPNMNTKAGFWKPK